MFNGTIILFNANLVCSITNGLKNASWSDELKYNNNGLGSTDKKCFLRKP